MAAHATVGQSVGVAFRVLVVDDNRHFRHIVSELLTERGFELVEGAADGEEAMAALTGACPDGVLLDVNLPGQDGYSVAASLVAACPTVRVVLTSSDVDDVPVGVLTVCGATAFIPKTELAAADLQRVFHGGGLIRPPAGPGGR
jgi:CheY-like chemotaxis protein